MKLEIKHLAPYLPNQLKFTDGKSMWELVGMNSDGEMRLLEAQYRGEINHRDGWNGIKPILRPLSSLTKPITHKGETFVPMVELLTLAYPTNDYSGRYGLIDFDTEGYPRAWFRYAAHRSLMIRTSEMESIQTWITNKLHEWHFDTNGLIESRLTIDVNTLPENPYAK